MTTIDRPGHRAHDTTVKPIEAISLEVVLARVRDHAARTDHEAIFPAAALDELRRSRLLGLLVPTAYGGLGGTLTDMLEAASRLSRECMSVGMIFAMHCQQVAAVLHHGSGRLRDELLPAIARGDLYLASVTTEAATGGHLLTSDTPLVGDLNHLKIDRTAPVVTGGMHADGFLITTQAPNAASPHQVSLIYAHRSQIDVEPTGHWNPLGMRGTDSRPLRLRGAVPAHQVVGDHGGFRDITVRTFAPLAHLGWSSCWLGTASGALARTVSWLRSPAERRRRDVRSELLLSRLATVRQRLETTHALIQHAACVYQEADRDLAAPAVQTLLNTVKVTASEQCFTAVDELVELAGLRHGYMRDAPLCLERAWRDLRSASLNYSNDRLRLANGTLTLMDQEVTYA
ncbi:acyl-CoA dehydrogenase family protein [Streptomyces sp. NPDC096046]|uniref:acyl-CoA dehydrogenase family protein n=1 Tax=Streptomyces sp. NPDC096046 TaxID=3155542 RepID=UPI003319B31B